MKKYLCYFVHDVGNNVYGVCARTADGNCPGNYRTEGTSTE